MSAGPQSVAAHASPPHALVRRLRLSLKIGLAVSPVPRWARPRDQRRWGRRTHTAAAVRPARTNVHPRLKAMTLRGLQFALTAASNYGAWSSSTSASSPGPATQAPDFAANDCARQFHVITADENRFAVERVNLPLSRAELDRTHAGLWTGTVAPMYNRSFYRPAPPKLVEGIREDDVQGIDPCRYPGPRDASTLETQYRSLRSAYTVANDRHKGTGKSAWGGLRLFVNGDSRLLYIHCVLFGTPVMGFLLRSLPPSAQCELGLPGSASVGARVQGRAMRAKVAEVAIQGMGGLTEALSGVAQAVVSPSAVSVATDIRDNAQALGAVMDQVRAALRDLVEDSEVPTTQLVLKHLLSQISKLTEPDL